MSNLPTNQTCPTCHRPRNKPAYIEGSTNPRGQYCRDPFHDIGQPKNPAESEVNEQANNGDMPAATSIPPQPAPDSGDELSMEAMLERVWLDGASLAGGAYLGKQTMRVAEAHAAIEALLRAEYERGKREAQ